MTILENVTLAPFTSYRIGGPARYFSRPQSIGDLLSAVAWRNNHAQPLFVLGRGSNVLISDSGWPGLVISLDGLASMDWENDTTVVAGSGALLHAMVHAAVRRGLRGMEELAGIPGSVGGGLVMNAGAFTQTISDCLAWVEGVSLVDGRVWRHDRSQVRFAYRSSWLHDDPSIVCRAAFTLQAGEHGLVAADFGRIMQQRRSKQPLDQPSCGSVFKRPPGEYAGRLIEAAGLKGLSIGGARISPRHANFFVNTGSATAADVRTLIVEAQRRVFENSGVLLEPEVIFVGSFDQLLFVPPAV